MELLKTVVGTPLGDLLAVADDDFLYYLGFLGQRHQAKILTRIETVTGATVQEGTSVLLCRLEKEMTAYFAGDLEVFSIPLNLLGTDFQQDVWQVMRTIPYGQTMTYKELAQDLGDSSKARAVGMACAANPVLLLNPCHRVLASDGGLGGYVAGLATKELLLTLEKSE